MSNHNNGVKYSNLQYKDTHFQAQFNIIYEGFFKLPQSMKELSVCTGIDRANICRYCKTLKESNNITVAKKGRCSITKRIVNKYTTNPLWFPINPQLKLF